MIGRKSHRICADQIPSMGHFHACVHHIPGQPRKPGLCLKKDNSWEDLKNISYDMLWKVKYRTVVSKAV